MIGRRQFVAAAGTGLAASMLPRMAFGAAGSLKVASVKYGSVSWLLETIKAEGLDAKAGIALDILEVANNQAGPVALLAGNADVIVSDWTWALRQQATGVSLRFSPYSSALGSLMVSNTSTIKNLADLEGKTIGVAGTAIDKSWVLLRAYSRKIIGKDIADIAKPVFGAAPLVTEEFRSGRLDAVLNFWTYAARLAGAGYVQVLSIADVLKALDITPPPPLVGFIWTEERGKTKGAEIEAFLAAAAAGNATLAKSEPAWERIRALVKPATDAEFAAIKSYYRSGITDRWGEAETKSAEKLTRLLVELGDTELVGNGTRFDPKLFHTAAG